MLISKKVQCGVSLVESMIALLVISVGLLGIAALQITAMKQNSSSLYHSQAVWFAIDIADRIRSNSGQFMLYNGVDTDNAPAQNCMANTCSPLQMRASDAAEWASMVQTLPSGRGLIVSPANNNLTIQVMWDDEGTGAGGTGCGPDPETDLTCYTVNLTQ